MFLCSLESSSRNKNVGEKIFEPFLNFFAFFDQNVILAPTQKSQIRHQNFFPKSGLNCTLVPLDYGNISFWMSQEGKKLRKIGHHIKLFGPLEHLFSAFGGLKKALNKPKLIVLNPLLLLGCFFE